jgi:hypothetical protein
MRTTTKHVKLLAYALIDCAAREHLRIGQLIVNAVGGDPFYVENDKLIQAVEAFCRTEGKSEVQK